MKPYTSCMVELDLAHVSCTYIKQLAVLRYASTQALNSIAAPPSRTPSEYSHDYNPDTTYK